MQINDATCTPVVSVLPPGTPTALRLMPPYPNPSHGTTRFAFELPRKEDRVEFKVFDTQGRQLRTESLGALQPGNHVWEWNGRDGSGRETSAGVYFVRLQAGSRTLTQRAFRLPR